MGSSGVWGLPTPCPPVRITGYRPPCPPCRGKLWFATCLQERAELSLMRSRAPAPHPSPIQPRLRHCESRMMAPVLRLCMLERQRDPGHQLYLSFLSELFGVTQFFGGSPRSSISWLCGQATSPFSFRATTGKGLTIRQAVNSSGLQEACDMFSLCPFD